MTLRTIVNVATGPRYIAGQERLVDSFTPAHGGRSPSECGCCFKLYRDCFPAACPKHSETPYAFKPLALRWDRDAAGRKHSALWCDASMIVNKPLDPIWEYIEEHGALLFQDGWSVGQWCADHALEQLGLTRDEAMTIPLIYGPIGLDFRNAKANEFLDEWCRYALDGVTFVGPWTNTNGEASSDPRCLGHRHDITVAATIAHRMGIPLYQGFLPFMEIGRERGAIIQLVGA